MEYHSRTSYFPLSRDSFPRDHDGILLSGGQRQWVSDLDSGQDKNECEAKLRSWVASDFEGPDQSGAYGEVSHHEKSDSGSEQSFDFPQQRLRL